MSGDMKDTLFVDAPAKYIISLSKHLFKDPPPGRDSLGTTTLEIYCCGAEVKKIESYKM